MTAVTIVGDAGTSNTGSPGARAPFTPVELLRALDGWLSETGHDDDHPWRASIAQTLEGNSANRGRYISDVEDLASDAFDLAAVIRAVEYRVEHFRINGLPTDEDTLVEFTRALRVTAGLAEALGCKAANLAEVAHG